MLVSHSDSHAAVELAERLRLRIEQHLFPGAGHLTASIGVAQWLVGDSDESIIARADAAMYAAKAAGRNCVRVAEENGG
jgi:diguanylate cyclase (GGDEF)-like protein